MFSKVTFLNYVVLFLFSWYLTLELVSCKRQLRALDEENWTEMLTGEWMVEFYAPWCPACQQLQPLWKELAEWSDDLSIKVGSIDVTLNPGLSGRFMITALPTIFHIKDGQFRQYRGARDRDAFITFVEEKKWEKVEPISSWKSPQSVQMTVLSCFFKISMVLRSIHNTMVEDYGIPYWGSYIVFGLCTILIGAFLGLVIVCVLDFFCPTKMRGYDLVSRTPDPRLIERESEGEYEGEDVIKEDKVEEAGLRRRIETSVN